MMPTAIHAFSRGEIMAYLDGELSPERAVAAAQHLEQCRECQRSVEDFQSVSARLMDWEIEPSTSAPPRLAAEPGAKSKPVRWHRPWLLLAGAAVLLFLIVAVPARLGRIVRDLKTTDRLRQYAEFATPTQASQAQAFVRTGAAPNAPPAALTDARVIRTAQLAVTSKNFDHSRADAEHIVKLYQGYIAELEFTTPNDASRSLNATLRVPAAQLDPVLQELKRLGKVTEESQRGEDVTQHYVDVNARLSNLRTTEGRLLQILRERAGKLADVLQVEEAVDRTRGEIEVTEAEQKMLSNQIALATVHLNISEEYKAPLEGNAAPVLIRLRNAAVQGYRNVVEGVIGIVAFLLSNGPALLIALAVVFFPVRWLWRRWQANRLLENR